MGRSGKWGYHIELPVVLWVSGNPPFVRAIDTCCAGEHFSAAWAHFLVGSCINKEWRSAENTFLSSGISIFEISSITSLQTHSLIEFFKKIKKWLEMVNLPPSFHRKVVTLERKFEVASIIFDKYRKVFCDLFNFPDEKQVPMTRQRGRKSKWV